MSDNVIQTSFSAGELAPSIYARTDLQKYHSGAATMRNFYVDYRSGASTRPGSKFVGQAFKSSTAVRLIPYVFSTTVAYVIEFGDFYCRFITNGGYVLETAINITAASLTYPATITVPGHAYTIGDWIYVTGIVGTIQLNGRFFTITNISGNVLTLADPNGVAVDARGFTAYSSGGTAGRVYTITSPYAAADLALLKFIQSASVMTICHTSYVPYTLTAASATSWTFAAITFGTTVAAPTGLGSSATAGTGAYYSYIVTAVDSNGQESLPSSALAVNNVVNITTTAGTITITWNAVAGASNYNIYKAELSVAGAVPAGVYYGFIGHASSTSFIDSNIVPDFTVTPPIVNNPFPSNNPGALAYFQQRLTLGGSNSNPTTFYMSQPGSFYNFNTTNPTQDDDSITGTIVSLQVNAIKHFVPMPGGLIALTSKGAYQISGGGGLGANAAITPADAQAIPQAYNGSSDVPPIISNFDVLYVQAKGAIVRDLSYNIYANIYTGTDISVLSNHLFYGHTIKEWAWAEEPNKIVWAVRDDGILLSLTFLKEQEIYGWARHDTKGLYQSVCTITEGQADAVYVVAKRYINGRWVQYIERYDNRIFTYGDYNPTSLATLPIPYIRANAESAWCVDAGVQSALGTRSATLTANTNTGTVTFNADSPVFTSADNGSIIRMGGGIATITSYVSTQQLVGTWTVSPTAVVPNDTANTPVPQTTGNWTITAKSTVFYGLDHLEGQTVSILADGGVVTQQTVTNGSITLANAASLVTVGLPFTAQLQTMYLDVGGGETIQGKRKKISALSIRAVNTRGLQAGRTFGTCKPIKELTPTVVLGAPIPLVIGDERIIMDPLWDVPGQICIQQTDPLPASVLGVIPEIEVGDTNK